MGASDASISLLVMAGTVTLTAGCRRAARRASKPRLRDFLLELLGAFQICACTHELRLLADLPPQPHAALTLTYIFTAVHGLTLYDSINNPCSSFQLFCKAKISVKSWWLQTSGQFAGAVLAIIYIRLFWMLGIVPVHARALAENCSNPIQTTVANAFLLELLFSSLVHLSFLQFESMNPKLKANLVALLITTLVYEGGKLTGAIFNPALAFSLHISCFTDTFWNYMLVYWIAPCIGSVMVVMVWDDILPLLRG
ncbi:aquaporin-11 [Varanus komodoensis]|uniref:Aquaporin 11 n=1 Tax=Varanus komodoensis TaxID=61221 RepID=A0A8D2KTQ2_VARKO|nr:aquaporin-11 [Varanus komodoensis]